MLMKGRSKPELDGLGIQERHVSSGMNGCWGKDIVCAVLPLSTLLTQCTTIPHSFSNFCLIMFAGLLHLLRMFLPSRLLTLPKISENIEISVNSPKTKRESDVGTASMATTLGQGADQPATHQGMRSSTASSLSDRLDTTEAETETLRSLTPGSSVESDNGHSRNNILSLPSLWTGQSEKVGWQTYASPSSHTELRYRLSPDHLTTSCLCLARTFAPRS